MLPRTRAQADPQAEATIASLRRQYQKQPKRHWGPIMAALAIGWVGAILFMSRTKNADPLADARLNNSVPIATPTPVPTPPAPRAELVRANPNIPRATLVNLGAPFQLKTVKYGDSFWVHMPDDRWIVATAMAQAKSVEELPLTGNRIGDARWIGEHCFVWLNPIGQTNPTWIDP